MVAEHALLKHCNGMMHQRTMIYVFKLLNMIVVNIAILSLTSMDWRHSNVDGKAAMLVIVVYVVDTMSSLDPSFEDSPTYAL